MQHDFALFCHLSVCGLGFHTSQCSAYDADSRKIESLKDCLDKSTSGDTCQGEINLCLMRSSLWLKRSDIRTNEYKTQ